MFIENKIGICYPCVLHDFGESTALFVLFCVSYGLGRYIIFLPYPLDTMFTSLDNPKKVVSEKLAKEAESG